MKINYILVLGICALIAISMFAGYVMGTVTTFKQIGHLAGSFTIKEINVDFNQEAFQEWLEERARVYNQSKVKE